MKNTRGLLLTAVVVMATISTAMAWIKTTTTTWPRTTTRPTTARPTTTRPTTTRPTRIPTTTTARPTADLFGKMFTLSRSGGVTLYPPDYSQPTAAPFGRSWKWQTTPPTAPPMIPNWSVCMRFLCEFSSCSQIFTVRDTGSYPLTLKTYSQTFQLGRDYSYNFQEVVGFVPIIKFMSESAPDLWKSVCITVDNINMVAQMFSGSNMSIRKILPYRISFSRKPVIQIEQFEGQVTDVQMWDYALQNREVISYMKHGFHPGTLITWSNMAYSVSGSVLLEDSYNFRANRQPVRRRGKGRRRIKAKKGSRKDLVQEGNKL